MILGDYQDTMNFKILYEIIFSPLNIFFSTAKCCKLFCLPILVILWDTQRTNFLTMEPFFYKNKYLSINILATTIK